MSWSEKYLSYLASEAWQLKRWDALERARFLCQRCGRSEATDVHHRTYVRLGHELPEDLVALCEICHKISDWERAERF
jgi:5-methylcytosine-specific restriction endonuclease McrA